MKKRTDTHTQIPLPDTGTPQGDREGGAGVAPISGAESINPLLHAPVRAQRTCDDSTEQCDIAAPFVTSTEGHQAPKPSWADKVIATPSDARYTSR